MNHPQPVTYPQVKQRLSKHRRFKLHFPPTSSSWLNLVRWFGTLTDQRIRRENFFSVAELEATIDEYLEENNKQPFVWTASVESWPKSIVLNLFLETDH